MSPDCLEYGCLGIITGGDSPAASWWKGRLVCWDSIDKDVLVFAGGKTGDLVPEGLEVEQLDGSWRIRQEKDFLTAYREGSDRVSAVCEKEET